MKLLFFFHETGLHNGAWKSAHNLLLGLREKGVDILVVTPDKHELYNTLIDEGFKVKAIKIVWNNNEIKKSWKYRIARVPYNLRRKVLSIVWWLRVLLIVKRFDPDVIHTNSSVFYLSYDIAKFLKIPHVWHIREYGDKDFNIDTKPVVHRFNDNYSSYICIARDLEKHRCLNRTKKSHVVYNGILNENEILYKPDKSNYFLYVGSLCEGKGIKDVIDAWLLFCNKYKNYYSLKIAGGHKSEILYYKDYVSKKSAGLSEKIEFLGKRDDVYDLMSEAKAVIMASYNEAFGRVTAEAMFCGALVIGRDAAGTKEQFDNGVKITGSEIGLRYTDKKGLLECIYTVMFMEQKEYDSYIARAQMTVKKLYTNEVYVTNVYNIYKSIISKK